MICTCNDVATSYLDHVESFLSNGNWRTLSSHARVSSQWLLAWGSLSHSGTKGDFWERWGLLLTVVPSEGMHTTQIRIHASYADIQDAEEYPHLSLKAVLHPGFRPLALSQSITELYFLFMCHAWLCALIHINFFFLYVLPLDLKSFPSSKIARVLPASENLFWVT